uniref:Uncharacterized protein n=1 Tax=Megaselia scalaris TaxID=36166 RepID=T1H379_MEGSC
WCDLLVAGLNWLHASLNSSAIVCGFLHYGKLAGTSIGIGMFITHSIIAKIYLKKFNNLNLPFWIAMNTIAWFLMTTLLLLALATEFKLCDLMYSITFTTSSLIFHQFYWFSIIKQFPLCCTRS